MITLEKAILEIGDMLYRRTISLNEVQKESLNLGKEAMKGIRDIRQKHPTYTIDLLPGETE